jgi:ABC-type sugar transport system permease subunit
MVAVVLIWAGPFFWMVLGSFKPPESIIANELVLRFTPTWENYDAIFSRFAFWTYTANSFLVAISTTIITVAASILAAYALSRYRAGGRLFEFWLMFTRMLPPATLLIPLFLIFRTLGLINTLTGLIIADASFLLSFSIWLLRGFFDEVPVGLEEAASCDGASRMQSLFYVPHLRLERVSLRHRVRVRHRLQDAAGGGQRFHHRIRHQLGARLRLGGGHRPAGGGGRPPAPAVHRPGTHPGGVQVAGLRLERRGGSDRPRRKDTA